MALITCAECGTQVSSAATSCTHCGARRKAMIGRQPITPLGWLWRSLLGLIALLVVVTGWGGRNPATKDQDAAKQAQIPADSNTDKRSARVVMDAASLKRSLRNPDSLVIESVRATKAGDVVCIVYRAMNGFGGSNREAAVFLVDAGGSTSAKLWHSFCRRGDFTNLTEQTVDALKAMGR